MRFKINISHTFQMVRRALLMLCVVALGGDLASAETVSQKEAKEVATMFFNSAHGQMMAPPKLVYNGRRLTTGSYFAPFYIYNLPAGGFVVISAENKAFPILGYSLTDSFSPDNMGEKQKSLLTMYARHIENVRYDSSVPYEAVAAWTNLPGYIDSMLKAPYSATDPRTSAEDAMAELSFVASAVNAAASASATYSPDQWNELISSELQVKPDVPLGIIDDEGMLSAVVYGRKGDMFRILLDERDKSLWRLMPTEIISGGQIAVLGNPPALPEIETAEEPFSFYNSYLATVEADEMQRRSRIEQPEILAEPLVRWHGSGHFSVTLPENVATMRVYSLDGQLVQRDAFRETNVANVSLTQNPTGFYFAVFFGESGKPYPVKLFR